MALSDKLVTLDILQYVYNSLQNDISELPVIQRIMIGDIELSPNEDHVIELPIATKENCGLIKGGDEISVSDSGELQIKAVNVNKLVQEDEDDLIFANGNSTF